MRRMTLFALLMLSAATLSGEETPDPALDAMKKVANLVGSWEGAGTIRMGPGEPNAFVGEESVEAKLGGRVLTVEGRHFSPDRSRVVHHAFATLTWDDASKKYKFRTQLVGRPGGDYDAWLEDGKLVWEIPDEKMPRRFYIESDGRTWKETGKVQRNGAWVQFFQMELTKKP